MRALKFKGGCGVIKAPKQQPNVWLESLRSHLLSAILLLGDAMIGL